MTLSQLKYVVEVVSCGTISKAAEKLYLAQPSLTAAIKELETELGITIFKRTNKGVVLTADGEEFLSYARQVIIQTNLIEERYSGDKPGRRKFCVSTQHYSFAVEAFLALLEECGGDEYDFRLRETKTYEIIEDVAKLKSEVGILFLNKFNEAVLRKAFREHELEFTRLFIAEPHIFVGKNHPLAEKRRSPWGIWRRIRACPTNKASTMPFILLRKFKAPAQAIRISWCVTVPPFSICSLGWTAIPIRVASLTKNSMAETSLPFP